MSVGRHLLIVVLVVLAMRLVMEAPLGVSGRVDLFGLRLEAYYVVLGILTALCGGLIEASRGKMERLSVAPGSVNWGLLLTQGVVAAMLTFIPPGQWAAWLGSGELWTVLYQTSTRIVAGVWFGIVLVRALSGDRSAA